MSVVQVQCARCFGWSYEGHPCASSVDGSPPSDAVDRRIWLDKEIRRLERELNVCRRMRADLERR